MWQWIADYELRWGVEIHSGWMVNAAAMTIRPDGSVRVSYAAQLDEQHARLAVTMMLGVLALGWIGARFRFRFPLPDDSPELRRASERGRRDYRITERWALRYLLPDEVLAQAEREEWEAWQLQEHSGLDAEACERRVLEWRLKRANARPATISLDGPIPF